VRARYEDQVPAYAGGDWPFDVDECLTHGRETQVKDGRRVCRDCGKVVEDGEKVGKVG